MKDSIYNGYEIAIIGMEGIFPDAFNVREFWNNLKNGKEAVKKYSDEELIQNNIDIDILKKKNYVKSNCNIDLSSKEYFDSEFFRYNREEGELMDPQLRITHQLVWNALEDSCYNPSSYKGLIGLYIGSNSNLNWEVYSLLQQEKTQVDGFTAQQLYNRDFFASRISYNLNLKGPSLHVQTACSTSLVAVHMACRGILTGECDIALAGGINILYTDKQGYLFKEGMINSPDGHCRAFDVDANGTIGGEGGGIVVLKRLKNALEDKDNIYAIIKGSAVNNDGDRKVGYAAPSIYGQVDVIKMAQKIARVEPESISYIEAHGTGTKLGDAVEVEALNLAFNNNKKKHCAIGSVKTNIGHLNTAAGIAGLIKTILSLQNKQIPPSLNFKKPNPSIKFEEGPFYVNTEIKDWITDIYPRRAGVSSFGIGGTNAHVILEEAPEINKSDSHSKYNLLLFSANSDRILEELKHRFIKFFEQNLDINLNSVAYTLQIGRNFFSKRQFIVADSVKEAIRLLEESGDWNYDNHFSLNRNTKICFMFPGQGAQYKAMGADLYSNNKVFRDEVNKCLTIFKKYSTINLQHVWIGEQDNDNKISDIDNTLYSQPILFIIEYSLGQLLIKLGLNPQIMIGHSLGEYVAACISGVFTLEEALRLIIKRSELMQTIPASSMISVGASINEIKPFLNNELSIAAINDTNSIVISGYTNAINKLKEKLAFKNISFIELKTSHGFHSPAVDSITEDFQIVLDSINYQDMGIPFVSNLTGDIANKNDIKSSKYWVKHLRETVRFYDGISKILMDENIIFLEVGPGKVLSSLLQNHESRTNKNITVNLLPDKRKNEDELFCFTKQLGHLWANGVSLNWNVFYAEKNVQRLSLPTYPYEKTKFPVNVNAYELIKSKFNKLKIDREDNINNWNYIVTWKKSLLPNNVNKGTDKVNNIIFCDQLGFADRLFDKSKENIFVSIGKDFAKIENRNYTVNPRNIDNYKSLFNDLKKNSYVPQNVTHLWNVTNDINKSQWDQIDYKLYLGLYSIVSIVQNIEFFFASESVKINVLVNKLHKIFPGDTIDPVKSMIIAAVQTIPKEYRNIECRAIEIETEKKRQYKNAYLSLIKKELSRFVTGIVAYKALTRWVPHIEKLNLHNEDATSFNEKSVCLLIGGLGGIGKIIAENMIERFNCKLIIIGRTELVNNLSGNEEQLVLQDDHRTKKCEDLQQLLNISEKITYITANINNKEELKSKIESAEKEVGKVTDVIHAAGIADYDGMIYNRRIDTFEKLLAAKVYGIIALDEIFSQHQLNSFICFSSVSSIIAPFGQVGYSAVNGFLDAYCYFKDGQSTTRYKSIGWGEWNNIGMAKEALEKKREIHSSNFAISKEDGIEAFYKSLSINYPHIIVTPLNIEAILKNELEIFKLGNNRRDTSKVGTTEKEVIYTKDLSDVEHVLLQLWKGIINSKDIDVNNDFFEMGGDSLKAMSLFMAINKKFNVQIPLKLIYDLNTIKKQSNYLISLSSVFQHPLKKAEKKEFYKVSSAQKRLIILNEFYSDNRVYNIVGYIFLLTRIEDKTIKEVFNELIERHDVLQSSFHFINGEPVQIFSKNFETNIIHYHCDSSSEEFFSTVERNRIFSEFNKPFNLKSGPLFRLGVVKLKDKDILLYSFHHTIGDATSNRIIIDDFIKIINGNTPPKLKFQYKDYCEWSYKQRNSKKISTQKEYWKNIFSGFISQIDLPIDFNRPEVKEFKGSNVNFEIDNALTNNIMKLSKSFEGSMYLSLLGIYYIFLSKICNQDDIVLGTSVSGRYHSDLKNIMGFFSNTLPLRNYPLASKSCYSFLKELKQNVLYSLDNQDYQFEDLVTDLKLKTDLSRNPLTDVFFIYSDQKDFGDKNELTDSLFSNSKFDLTLSCSYNGNSVVCQFEYDISLFRKETILRFVNFFTKIAKEVCSNQKKTIGELEIIDEKEKREILFEFNTLLKSEYEDQTIYDLFKNQVTKTPNKVALVSLNSNITYLQLDMLIDYISDQLLQRGISSGNVIGLLAEKSIEFIASVFSIVKVGGSYIPLSPDYPNIRIEYVLRDANVQCVLIQHKLDNAFNHPAIKIYIDKEYYLRSNICHNIVNRSHDFRYIIYTSGSTGIPKGVLIENLALKNFILNLQNRFPVNSGDVYLFKASVIFDLSLHEIFGWFLNGGSLYIAVENEETDFQRLTNNICKYGITHITFVPSIFTLFLSSLSEELRHKLNCLRYIFVVGEVFLKGLALKYYDLKLKAHLVNGYGPTEAAICTSSYLVRPDIHYDDTIPIGKPFSNVRVYILDKHLNLQPKGIKGQICIGGISLAKGYLNLVNKTAEKFYPDPYNPEKLMYLSGDFGKWLNDGNLVFSGRIDNQIKIKGFRIELTEIEENILKYQNIKEVTVIVDPRDKNSLIACYLSHKNIDIAELRSYLKERIPYYMIPDKFVRFEQFPLTTSGKMDRIQLASSIQLEVKTPSKTLFSATENKLVRIWSDVLKLDVRLIRNTDNFFDIGGNSLRAIDCVLKIKKQFNVEFTVPMLYSNQSINEQANVLDEIFLPGKSITKLMKNIPFITNDFYLLNGIFQKNIYCFPPAGSYGVVYKKIASVLENISVYAFNFQKPQNEYSFYIENISKKNNKNPIVLMGYSAAGKLLFETAYHLEKQGLIVKDIILLDCIWLDFEENIDKNNEIDIDNRKYIINAIRKHLNIEEEFSKGMSVLSIDNHIDTIVNNQIEYLNYRNSINHLKKINCNLHFICNEDNVVHNTEWEKYIKKEIFYYKGFGKHHEMITNKATHNAKIISSILFDRSNNKSN